MAFARRQAIAPRALDLNETLRDVLKMLKRLVGEDIHLRWLPRDPVGPVMMDPAQVTQVLTNLCVNARDAIVDGGTITIETHRVLLDEDFCAQHSEAVPGPYVLLAVSDDGCGMSPETLTCVFEPFFTTKDAGRGTGLGLPTVYGIIKQNNGFITVHSEQGRGTTFRIYLPFLSDLPVPAEVPTTRTVEARGRETILLVEDEPALLKVGRRMLEKLGYRILAASGPTVALDLAHQAADPIDLLMTDVVMPDMNGPELAEKLQSAFPAMKCLFMSGYAANIVDQHRDMQSRVRFLPKPFSPEELAAKVREALDD